MPRDLKPLRAVIALEVHESSWPEVLESLRLRLRPVLLALLLALLLVLLLAWLLLLLLLAFPLSPGQSHNHGRQTPLISTRKQPKQTTNDGCWKREHSGWKFSIPVGGVRTSSTSSSSLHVTTQLRAARVTSPGETTLDAEAGTNNASPAQDTHTLGREPPPTPLHW